MDSIKLFPCYSIPLKNYLVGNGIRYELVGLNPKTKNMFWVFIISDDLKRLLDTWALHCRY